MFNNLYKSAFGFAVVALALTACSSDDTIIDEVNARNEIGFNVTANTTSRATAYTAATQITDFKVSAWFHGTTSGTYFNHETMTGSNGAWLYGSAETNNIRYWPNNGEKLDFYAWVDYANETGDKHASKGYVLGFDGNGAATLSDGGNEIAILDSNEAVDLLYASAYDQVRDKDQEASKQVTLNFKHACAQVGVTAQVINPNIYMEIKEVALVNIYKSGIFHFPTSATDNASWTTAAANKTSGEVKYENANAWTLANGADATPLNVAGNRFMVLPQAETEAFDATKITTPCIRLACKVWNVTDGETYTPANDLQIYGGAGATVATNGYKYLYIPVDFAWEMGKNYTYNLTFGTGHAGLDTEANATLVKVDYNVEFTGWTDADDVDIEQ